MSGYLGLSDLSRVPIRLSYVLRIILSAHLDLVI